MFCHHLIEFDKVQDLGLYNRKVLIKFDINFKKCAGLFLSLDIAKKARFVFLLIITKLSSSLTDSAW